MKNGIFERTTDGTKGLSRGELSLRFRILLKSTRLFSLLLALYLFFLAITMMGTSFKSMGSGTSERLISLVTNPLAGLFIGILATSIVQSSSCTTSIAVVAVASGQIPLHLAIPIIIGANIGTSVTATLVSLAHVSRRREFRRAFAGATVHDLFNVMAAMVFFPLEVITRSIFGVGYLERISLFLAGKSTGKGGVTFLSPIKVITNPIVDWCFSISDTSWIWIIVSLILLFLALKILTSSIKSLMETKVQKVVDKYFFRTAAISFIFGLVITAIIQSSSVTTSLAIPFVGSGMITLEQIFPFTLGANIGTTVTALLSSLVTESTDAVALAFSHLAFNVSAVILFYPFRKIPISTAKRLGRIVMKRRHVAIIIIIVFFFLIPLTVVLLTQLFN